MAVCFSSVYELSVSKRYAMTSYGYFYYLIQQVIFLVLEGVELLTKLESVGRRFPVSELPGKTGTQWKTIRKKI